MPSAGAVIPPTIIPLRNPLSSGKPTLHIDTKTYIELESGMCFTSLTLYTVCIFSCSFSTMFDLFSEFSIVDTSQKLTMLCLYLYIV